MALNSAPGVWMNTLSKKNGGSLNLPYAQQGTIASSSKYNLAQLDAVQQQQQQQQQLQIKLFKGEMAILQNLS
jgi:hypothetical protein